MIPQLPFFTGLRQNESKAIKSKIHLRHITQRTLSIMKWT